MNRKDLPEPNATCEICGHRYRICNKCLQMRSRGIEAWRQHCDSPECYLVYIAINNDYDNITKEQLNNLINMDLPEDRQFTKETQQKLDAIEHYLLNKEKRQEPIG